jgi:hypothetical protein
MIKIKKPAATAVKPNKGEAVTIGGHVGVLQASIALAKALEVQTIAAIPFPSIEEDAIEYRRLKDEIESREERAAAIRLRLIAGMQAAKLEEKVVDGGFVGKYRVTYTSVKGRTTLDKTKLIEAGVSEEQLKKGTKTGEPSYRLEVERVEGGKQ